MGSATPAGPTDCGHLPRQKHKKDGSDGHKGRPRRIKKMGTCSAVLVACTWFCPTVCGWELGQLGQGWLFHLNMIQ